MDNSEILEEVWDEELIYELKKRGYKIIPPSSSENKEDSYKNYDFIFKVKSNDNNSYDLYGIDVNTVFVDWIKFFKYGLDREDLLSDLGTDMEKLYQYYINNYFTEKAGKEFLKTRIYYTLNSLVNKDKTLENIPKGVEEYCEFIKNIEL